MIVPIENSHRADLNLSNNTNMKYLKWNCYISFDDVRTDFVAGIGTPSATHYMSLNMDM
jgi:hypothetical protein